MLKLSLPFIIESVIYIAVCGFGVWKGGKPERIVGAAMLAEYLLLAVLHSFQRTDGPRYVTMVLDFMTLIAILYATFTSNRRWLLWASAFQILSLLALVTRLIDPYLNIWSYLTVGFFYTYGLAASLVFGTVQVMWKSRGTNHERH